MNPKKYSTSIKGELGVYLVKWSTFLYYSSVIVYEKYLLFGTIPMNRVLYEGMTYNSWKVKEMTKEEVIKDFEEAVSDYEEFKTSWSNAS